MSDPIADLNIPYETDVPLGPLTWYGIGGSASILAHPSTVQQLSALIAHCHETNTPIRVLGSGANLLVADVKLEGIVVKLDHEAFRQLRIEGTRVSVGAGYDLFKLVLETARAGLAGLEALAGVPATVGGAVRMNAGGQYGEIGPHVARIMVCDKSGQIYYRDRDDLVFGYRHANISAPFILDVEFELQKDDPAQLMNEVKKIFMLKKNAQPLGESSAGCTFKNPGSPADDPEAAAPPPAGQLIDEAGLKGLTVGGAEVSHRHANFIVAHEGCTATDILQLISDVQAAVLERTGIELQREVVVWNND